MKADVIPKSAHIFRQKNERLSKEAQSYLAGANFKDDFLWKMMKEYENLNEVKY